jgi:hypothetical protein
MAIEHGFGFHLGCAYIAEIYREADDLDGFLEFAKQIVIDDHREPTVQWMSCLFIR